MKTAVIASPLVASEGLESSIMGMDASGISQATYFMRDKIYSNKILAVVREYACNAIDEHTKWNIATPVEIGFRQEGQDVIFFVRDFAHGLDENGVRNIFGMYFRSTKSSDNNCIGGFGVGSKAGHCYNDTFFVTSHCQGKKTTYTCMLGGGDNGVPVGHIYEIDSCDTNESGLEVSLPIKSTDVEKFQYEITRFVQHSPAKINFHQLDGSIVPPAETVIEKAVDGFTFRLVNIDPRASGRSVLLQMGGVIYDHIDYSPGFSIKSGHTLLVNMPVGTISIPISRESFENTPSNQKVIEKIHQILADLSEKDLARFKTLSPAALVRQMLDDRKAATLSTLVTIFNGDMFSAKKSALFRDVWPLLNYVRETRGSTAVEMKNGKPILLNIPNGQSEKYWNIKLMSHCNANNLNYYYAPEHIHSSITVDLNPYFHVMSVRNLNYPKVKRNSKKFTVYTKYSSMGLFSALEFHNHVFKSMGLPEAQNETQAKHQIESILLKAKKKKDIVPFVVADRSCPKNDRVITYYTGSAVMMNELVNLGWLDYGSAKYRQHYDALAKLEEVEFEKQNAIASCKRRWLEFSRRTKQLIDSNPEYALRIVRFWHTINQENSFRSKVIKSFNSSGYSGPVYSRAEFRAVMKLK
jgi:hypothetical protein